MFAKLARDDKKQFEDSIKIGQRGSSCTAGHGGEQHLKMLKCLLRDGENKNGHFFLNAGSRWGIPTREVLTWGIRWKRWAIVPRLWWVHATHVEASVSIMMINDIANTGCGMYVCQSPRSSYLVMRVEVCLFGKYGRYLDADRVWSSAWLGECCVGRHHSIVGSRRCSYVSWLVLGCNIFWILNVDPFLSCCEI